MCMSIVLLASNDSLFEEDSVLMIHKRMLCS